jgi:hypothetical protein
VAAKYLKLLSNLDFNIAATRWSHLRMLHHFLYGKLAHEGAAADIPTSTKEQCEDSASIPPVGSAESGSRIEG